MTPLQQAGLEFIRNYVAARRGSPSYQEITEAIGCSNRSRAHEIVVRLERLGLVTRLPYVARSVRPVEEIDKLAARLLDNIIEEQPEVGWVKVRAEDIAALDLVLALRPQRARRRHGPTMAKGAHV